MDRVRSHHGVGQEIHSLRTLVRRHILDRDALKDAGFRFLYFIDAHELKAYIHGVSKDFVEGFELGPEEALRASGEWPHMLAELRLKCELAIRWILFDQPCPVVVLPPHGVEIEEEIAYQRHRELVRDLGLLKDAKEQLRELRRGRFAGQLLSQLASQALRGNDKSKTDLMEYLLRAAPALAVMLKIVPDEVDSIQSRIQKLVTRSNLSTLRTVNWAEYGLNDEEAEIIRRVGLDEGRVAHWQQRLEDSRNNSVRSNRLDAEAIAYVEGLNESLSRHGIRARGVLVTHTATLIQATRHPPPLRARPHGTDDPIRHIRLLVWDDSSTADSPPADGHIDDPLGRAAESLELALEVYYGQIDARGGNPFNLPMREAGALMDAWTAFETARSTLKLGRRGQISRDLEKTQWPGESEIETLLQWLRSERDLESLVAERLSSLVNTFGREVLTASGLKDLQVFVRFSPGEMGHHTMVLPVADRFLGPIELPEQRAVKSVGSPTRNVFPHDMAAIGEGSPQSYLTLALLHAAKGSLPLAEVYAKAATDSADFLKHPALGAESRLLNAQLHRMTAARANAKSRVPAESRARLDNALRFLEESARFRHSPRADLERAAINLERLVHNLDSDGSTKRLFAAGIDAIERAYPFVRDAVPLRMRAAELALGFVVADRAVSRDYGTSGVVTSEFLQYWHTELERSIDELRAKEDYLLEDLPWLTRALEVIGYSMIHNDQVQSGQRSPVPGDCGIPNSLSLDIHSVQRGLTTCDDRLSHIVAQVLAGINSRSGTGWMYSFIHAPVWDRRDVARAIAHLDGDLRESILQANDLLDRIGEDQRILIGHPEQLALFRKAKRQCEDLVSKLHDGMDVKVRFLVQMGYCYACLLECGFTHEKDEKDRLLRELAARYQSLRDEFGPSAGLLYRQSIVLGDLGQHSEALEAIQQALQTKSDDPFIDGASWMKSTLRRRMGLHFAREAKDQLAQLKLGPRPKELYERYRSTLREAFRSIYEDFDVQQGDSSPRSRAERLRRLNNIVYYACLYMQAEGELESLHEGFTRETFKAFLCRLKADAPAVEREWFYAHTIGAAHHALEEAAAANDAADKLLSLLARSGASTQSEAIRDAIEDAFSWKRAAPGISWP